MKGLEDKQIEEAETLIDEAIGLLRTRQTIRAWRNLNELKALLLGAKDVTINPDLELGKDISLNGQSPQEKKREE